MPPSSRNPMIGWFIEFTQFTPHRFVAEMKLIHYSTLRGSTPIIEIIIIEIIIVVFYHSF